MKKLAVMLLMLIVFGGCSSTENSSSVSYPIDRGTYIDYGDYIEYKTPGDNEVKAIYWGDKIVIRVGTCTTDLKVMAIASNAYIAGPDQNADYSVIEGGGTANGHNIYFGLDDQIKNEVGYYINIVVDGVAIQYVDLGAL